jgi:purine-nucleoside phosphorylase
VKRSGSNRPWRASGCGKKCAACVHNPAVLTGRVEYRAILLYVYQKLRETVDTIRTFCHAQPVLGFILGSGLGAYPDFWTDTASIPFSEIPHFLETKINGHAGNLVFGCASGVPSIALQGRVHLYEGCSVSEATYPVRALGALGIRRLILINAAGAVNETYKPGEFMLIRDHINFMGVNPLVGPNLDEAGPRFPDMTEAYDPGMREIALKAAREKNIPLHEGVYMAFLGPSFETPAEIRMCRALGADAVGMSTVPETIVARHMGIPTLAISCITNMAAGILSHPLTHEEVLETAGKAQLNLVTLLKVIVSNLRSTQFPH